jgi:hypothetical protein
MTGPHVSITDLSSREGAEHLAKQVEAHWRAQGLTVYRSLSSAITLSNCAKTYAS